MHVLQLRCFEFDHAHAAQVMHILPDDTGTSAIWAAQRLEEGHAAVVPNTFIIRDVALDDIDRCLVSRKALILPCCQSNNTTSAPCEFPPLILKRILD